MLEFFFFSNRRRHKRSLLVSGGWRWVKDKGLTQLTEQIEAGKKKRNDIEQDTTIRIRAKNLEAEQKALEIDQQREFSRLSQEREIAKQRDRERTDMAIETATQQRLAEEARIQSEEDIEKARIQQQDT